MNKGDKIRIIQMNDCNGTDCSVHKMNGKDFIVDYIDDIGQIHLIGSGLAVIPNIDDYIIIKD
jgi:hypothetical protein